MEIEVDVTEWFPEVMNIESEKNLFISYYTSGNDAKCEWYLHCNGTGRNCQRNAGKQLCRWSKLQ